MATALVNKRKRVIPGGKADKELVILGKTAARRMKRAEVIPDKTLSKEPQAKPFALTDSNISKANGDSAFAKTMIENIYVAGEFDGNLIESASRTPYQTSDIASILLKMIGGRLGLPITSNSMYR